MYHSNTSTSLLCHSIFMWKKPQTEFLLMFHHEEGFLWVIHSVYSHYQRLSTVTRILQNAVDFFYASLYFIILSKKKFQVFKNFLKIHTVFLQKHFYSTYWYRNCIFFKYTVMYIFKKLYRHTNSLQAYTEQISMYFWCYIF